MPAFSFIPKVPTDKQAILAYGNYHNIPTIIEEFLADYTSLDILFGKGSDSSVSATTTKL